MKKAFLVTTTCLLAAPLAAQAGGLEKSGQPVTLLFEKGDVVQLDLAYGIPSVTGVDSFGTDSDDAAEDFLRYGGGIKKDFNDKWSAALIVDEPYGADLAYAPSNFAFGGTFADFHSVEATGLARYKLNKNFSVHAGLRVARFGGDAATMGAAYGPLSGYSFQGEDDWGLGYVVGVAYEIPEKALRVALTYGSAIDFELDLTETFPDAVGGLVMIAPPKSPCRSRSTSTSRLASPRRRCSSARCAGRTTRAGRFAHPDLPKTSTRSSPRRTTTSGHTSSVWVGSSPSTGPARCRRCTSPASTRRSARSTRRTVASASAWAPAIPPTGIKIGGGVEYRWLGELGHPGSLRQCRVQGQLRARRGADALGPVLTGPAPHAAKWRRK